MTWFWIRLGKYFDKRNGVVRDPAPNNKINWTKAPKPFEEMNEGERDDFISRLAEGIFGKWPKKDNN